jgi:hypothetical protein
MTSRERHYANTNGVRADAPDVSRSNPPVPAPVVGGKARKRSRKARAQPLAIGQPTALQRPGIDSITRRSTAVSATVLTAIAQMHLVFDGIRERDAEAHLLGTLAAVDTLLARYRPLSFREAQAVVALLAHLMAAVRSQFIAPS